MKISGQDHELEFADYFADLLRFFGFTCCMCFLASLGLGPNGAWPTHLGAEYHCISQSIVNGQGFSNPFTAPTGATAWMPPLLPWVMAAVALCTGQLGLTFLFCLSQMLLVAANLSAIVQISRYFGDAGVGYVTAIAFSFAEFHNLFGITHDSVFLMSLTTITVVVLAAGWDKTLSMQRSGLWGLWGGLLAHASPALALAWAAATAIGLRKQPRQLIVAALVSVACVTPWCLRNALVFHTFVPIKSNAGFDAYQANVDDVDGILGNENFVTHPWQNEGRHRDGIRRMGEVAYSQQLGRQFIDHVISNPLDYAKKVRNRLLAATFDFRQAGSTTTSIFWLFYPKILHALPWLSLLAVPFVRLPKLYWIALLFMLVYLVPYLLITYYDRYGAPLLTLKAMMVALMLIRFRSAPAQ